MSQTSDCHNCGGTGVGRIDRDHETGRGVAENCPTCQGMGQLLPNGAPA